MNKHGPSSDRESEGEQQRPTIRDKRRIDPETYQVREPQATAAPAPAQGTEQHTGPQQKVDDSVTNAAEVAELKAALAERTGDLQRLQAEYINYKRRVERDRDVSRKTTIEAVLKDFFPVLDDLRSAREHEELTGGFKAVADEVERLAGKYGVQTFGQAGDPFDPHIHEALLHAHAEGLTGPTCVEILQPGYRIGDKVLRPARVAVAEPSPEQVGDSAGDQAGQGKAGESPAAETNAHEAPEQFVSEAPGTAEPTSETPNAASQDQ